MQWDDVLAKCEAGRWQPQLLMYELANRATVNKIQVLPNESDAPATPRTPSANEYGEATDALDEGAYGDLGLVDDPSCASPSIADLRLGASPSTRPADATNAPPGLAPKRGTVGN